MESRSVRRNAKNARGLERDRAPGSEIVVESRSVRRNAKNARGLERDAKF